MYYETFIAGIGGQGVLLMGNLLSYYGINDDLNTTFMPSYGVEMRGGMTHCTIILSDKEIGSPILKNIDSVTIMSPGSWRFAKQVKEGGKLILNSSLIGNVKKCEKNNIETYRVPFNKIAEEIGNPKLSNMVALGVIWGITQPMEFDLDKMEIAMGKMFGESKKKFIPGNIAAIKKGIEYTKSVNAE